MIAARGSVSRWSPVRCNPPRVCFGAGAFQHLYLWHGQWNWVYPHQVCWWHLAQWFSDMTETRNAIQRDLDKLAKWAHVNRVRFNKAKSKIVAISNVYRLGEELFESSHAALTQEGFRCSGGQKSWTLASNVNLQTKKPTVSLTASRDEASGSRNVTVFLCSALMRPHL